jgi:nucleoside-diphosphate kinase
VALEHTLAIIKPDAVERGLQGEILKRIHEAGFQVLALKSLRLSRAEAEGFYAVHRDKPFFAPLTEFMSSGKVFVMVLEAEDAIARWREVMGATDPAQAASGTIRKEFGSSIQNNCTHGSDAPDTALVPVYSSSLASYSGDWQQPPNPESTKRSVILSWHGLHPVSQPSLARIM